MSPTERARKQEIAAKVAESTENYSVPWQNKRESLKVINISVNNVLLNPKSHRIRSQIESHPQAGVLADAPFSEAAQRIIEKILEETTEFQALVDNLRESGQLESGIITDAGVLVNANTRAVALRRIGAEYIRVGVLPASATEEEITDLEARLQLARDYKQDYTLTNELLFIKEQIDASTSKEELAILLGKAQSRSQQHLRKGIAEIDKSLRILQHIREMQEFSEGAIPLTFFDPHESALTEADNAFMALRDQSPDQARRVRDGRMTGVLVGVTYRNLRNWDSDRFLEDYVEPQFDGDEALVKPLGGVTTNGSASEGSDPTGDGLDILTADDEATDSTLDPSEMLINVAGLFGKPNESQVTEGLTKEQLFDGLQERLTQAAQERDQDRRDERAQSKPIQLVREARQKLERAHKALSNSTLDSSFDHGKFRYELRRVRKEVDSLNEANQRDA